MTSIGFDHIEVHVQDIPRYAEFLKALFGGGRSRQISDSGTTMFIPPDGPKIEIKALKAEAVIGTVGFCLPCIRAEGARAHIESTLALQITKTVTNPDGEVYFFVDHEGVEWHMKDYAFEDRFVSW